MPTAIVAPAERLTEGTPRPRRGPVSVLEKCGHDHHGEQCTGVNLLKYPEKRLILLNSNTEPATTAARSLEAIGAVYDHVAHALPSIRDALPLYRDLLGGRPVVGGINPWAGHLAVQLEFPGGGRVELLEPVQPDAPSVGRFLRDHPRGGLHHITFKVHDLEAALAAVTADGFTPFATLLDNPSWRETFLHPRQTGGVLIQLAQAGPGVPPLLERPIEDLLDEAEAARRSFPGPGEGP